MLKHVRLENFKKFESVALPLRQFVVLMGENGSGKTSLLQAIALAGRAFAMTDLISYDPVQERVSIRNKGVPYAQLPGLYVEDPKDVFYAKRTRASGGGMHPIRIRLTDWNDNVYSMEVTTLFGAYNARCASTAADFPGEPLLDSRPPLFISGFVGIQASEERFFPLAIQDRLTRGRASEVLRNLLLELYLRDRGKFDRLRAKVKSNFDFQIGDVHFNEERDINIHADYREIVGSRVLDLDLSSAGSGFLQVLQILVPIYRYSPPSRIILLDEPDAHLHPNLQRTIARVLQEVAKEEGLQIIVSTHSTAIIREVDPEAVIPVTNLKTELTPISSGDALESEISLRIDNFTAAKASISGKVVFVEDHDTSILEKIDSLADLGLFEGAHTVPVMSAHGKDDKVPFRIKSALEVVTGTPVTIFFIRDGDGMPTDLRRKLEEYATKNDVELVLLERHEIESYLISPELIRRVLEIEGCILSKEEIERMLVEVMDDVISKSRYGFDRTLRDSLHKTGRLLKEDFTFTDAESQAGKIRHEYERLTQFDDLVKVAPAKETLKEFYIRLKAKTGVQMTSARLLRELRREDLDRDLINQLKAISTTPPSAGPSVGLVRQRLGVGLAALLRKRQG